MESDWILDVLADLRTFALSSDLTALAEQLDDTALVALGEIAVLNEMTQGGLDGHDLRDGTCSGGFDTS